MGLDTKTQVVELLSSVLNLGDRARGLELSTPLLGAVPELDSMAVVSLLTALEDRFGIAVDDDEIDGRTFASVGDLVAFVDGKLAA